MININNFYNENKRDLLWEHFHSWNDYPAPMSTHYDGFSVAGRLGLGTQRSLRIYNHYQDFSNHAFHSDRLKIPIQKV